MQSEESHSPNAYFHLPRTSEIHHSDKLFSHHVTMAMFHNEISIVIYINDLPNKITSTLKLFADDSYLYRIIKNPQDILELQKDLDMLSEWENDWSMEFNPDKCKMLRITNKRKPIIADYTLHDHELEAVDSAKYLGILVHKRLSWKLHVDNVCKRANQTRAFLQRNLKDCPIDIKSQCYNTYVRPKLEFASVVWDPVGEGNDCLRNQIEMVQRRAARFALNDWRQDSSPTEMIERLKWQTLEERRHVARLMFMHKFENNVIDIDDHIIMRSRRINSSFQPVFSRVRPYANSFIPRTRHDWNSLPSHIRTEGNTTKFKTKLITYMHSK